MGLRVFLLICLLLLADAQKWPVNGDCQPCQCYYKMTIFGRMRSVNCSDRALTAIPANLPHDLTALDLSWNTLDAGQLRETLCKFKSLQSLTLSFTDLTSLAGILKECSTVLELNLTGNRLNQVDSTTFQGLDNLRRLLGLEVETVLTADVFRHLTQLKDLDLAFYGKSLPQGLFDGMVIQSLNLVLTQAASLPQGVFDFGQRTLNTLELVGERVTALPPDLLDGLSVLRKLYLTAPSLQLLPDRFFQGRREVEGPVNLQEVEITGVRTFPPGLFNGLANLETLLLKEIGSFPQVGFLAEVVNLRMLVVTGSKLTRIPASWFRELYSLSTLKLSGDQLAELDDDVFSGLLNLKELDLSYNNLKRVTGTMLRPLSRTLETLILNNNFLTALSRDVLSGLRSLRFLDVSENRLTNVFEDSFVGMTYLTVLYLHNNRLTSLPRNLFEDQMQLERLSLADNYLVEFPPAILTLQASLVTLDLSSNEIRQVPAYYLCGFYYLDKVDISNNLLNCDCDVLAFHLCPNTTVTGECSTPQKYAGRDLNNVPFPPSCKFEKKQATTGEDLDKASAQTYQRDQQTSSQDSNGETKVSGSSGHTDSKKPNSTVIRNLFKEDPGSPESRSQPDDESSDSSVPEGKTEKASTEQKESNESGKENGVSLPGQSFVKNSSSSDSSPAVKTGGLEDKGQGLMMGDASSTSEELDNNAGRVKTTATSERSGVSFNNLTQSASGKENAGEVSTTAKSEANKSPAHSPSDNSAPTGGEKDGKPGDRGVLQAGSRVGGASGEGWLDKALVGGKLGIKQQSTNVSVNTVADLSAANSTGQANVSVAQTNGPKVDDGSNTPVQNPEKMAFNFTISAIAALLVFGCALLVVLAVRRWQHKGSYIIANNDSDQAELNNLEVQADKACVLQAGDQGQGETPIDKQVYK